MEQTFAGSASYLSFGHIQAPTQSTPTHHECLGHLRWLICESKSKVQLLLTAWTVQTTWDGIKKHIIMQGDVLSEEIDDQSKQALLIHVYHIPPYKQCALASLRVNWKQAIHYLVRWVGFQTHDAGKHWALRHVLGSGDLDCSKLQKCLHFQS